MPQSTMAMGTLGAPRDTSQAAGHCDFAHAPLLREARVVGLEPRAHDVVGLGKLDIWPRTIGRERTRDTARRDLHANRVRNSERLDGFAIRLLMARGARGLRHARTELDQQAAGAHRLT